MFNMYIIDDDDIIRLSTKLEIVFKTPSMLFKIYYKKYKFWKSFDITC